MKLPIRPRGRQGRRPILPPEQIERFRELVMAADEQGRGIYTVDEICEKMCEALNRKTFSRSSYHRYVARLKQGFHNQ